ncbi:hypothetical protein CYLTODRAFT_493659 [Cylindrobasidium torrendii FP15055 ss-10]|uniref:F-box domain-containing protein n=1 Tax=Cylindrobasidium torrendii FP15055 ss-10 TaxID=1314674 RepID=A0A0D7AZI2_9AGAR|nr:hypothetical protein CYLTODRAFT_493659 [Cylindrobasidium torrendii FP15055 ss-10]
MSIPVANLLDRLPLELLEHILLFLDIKELSRCRRTTKKLQSFIDASTRLTYALEISKNGLVDNLACRAPVVEKLNLLRRTRARYGLLPTDPTWQFEAKTMRLNQMPWEFYGNVMAFYDLSARQLRCMRVPGVSVSKQKSVWNVKTPAFVAKDFTLDPSQNLLVFVNCENQRNTQKPLHRFRIWTLQGVPHPAASIPEITIETEDIFAEDIFYHMRLSGEHLGVLFQTKDLLMSVFACWNWKTGKLVTLLDHGIVFSSFAFLDNRHLFVTVPGLVIIPFRHCDPNKVVRTMRGTFISFELPFVQAHPDEEDICCIRADPQPDWPNADPSVPFYDEPNELVYTVEVYTEEEQPFFLVIPRKTVLPWITQAAIGDRLNIPWKDWGPHGTRAFYPRFHAPPTTTWMCPSFGSNLALFGNQRKTWMVIYDFNQARVKAEVLDGARHVKSPVKPAKPMKSKEWEVCTRKSTVKNTLVLKEPFETFLPFRCRSVGFAKQDGDRAVLLSQNGVIVLTEPYDLDEHPEVEPDEETWIDAYEFNMLAEDYSSLRRMRAERANYMPFAQPHPISQSP